MRDERKQIRNTHEPLISAAVARRDAAALHVAVSEAAAAIHEHALLSTGFDAFEPYLAIYGLGAEKPIVRVVDAVLAGADLTRDALRARHAGPLRGYVRSGLLAALDAVCEAPSLEAAQRVIRALPVAR